MYSRIEQDSVIPNASLLAYIKAEVEGTREKEMVGRVTGFGRGEQCTYYIKNVRENEGLFLLCCGRVKP